MSRRSSLASNISSALTAGLASASDSGVRACSAHGLGELALVEVCRGGELRPGGSALEACRQLPPRAAQSCARLLVAARYPDRAATVAQVSLHLPEDVRHGEGSQRHPASRLVPVDCLDQADRPDLNEILQLLSAVRVTPRERLDERQLLLDQPLSRLEVQLCRGVRAHPRIYFRDFRWDLQSLG